MKNNSFLIYGKHFRQFYHQEFQSLCTEYDLSQLEIDILLFLKNNPSFNTARDICLMRGFAKSNVSKALETLKAKGYIFSQEDAESRKVHRLFLKPEKESAIQKLLECQKSCFAVMLQGFSEKELELFRSLMQRVDENMVCRLKQ